jgi:hypothetical protein
MHTGALSEVCERVPDSSSGSWAASKGALCGLTFGVVVACLADPPNLRSNGEFVVIMIVARDPSVGTLEPRRSAGLRSGSISRPRERQLVASVSEQRYNGVDQGACEGQLSGHAFCLN